MFSKYSILLSFYVVLPAVCQMGDHEGEEQNDLPPHVMNMKSPVLTPLQALDAFVVQESGRQKLASRAVAQDGYVLQFATFAIKSNKDSQESALEKGDLAKRD